MNQSHETINANRQERIEGFEMAYYQHALWTPWEGGQELILRNTGIRTRTPTTVNFQTGGSQDLWLEVTR